MLGLHATPDASGPHQCPLAAYHLRQVPIAGVWVFLSFSGDCRAPIRDFHLTVPKLG